MQGQQGVGICSAWLRWQIMLCNTARGDLREQIELAGDISLSEKLRWSIGDAQLKAHWLEVKVMWEEMLPTVVAQWFPFDGWLNPSSEQQMSNRSSLQPAGQQSTFGCGFWVVLQNDNMLLCAHCRWWRRLCCRDPGPNHQPSDWWTVCEWRLMQSSILLYGYTNNKT